MLPAPPLTVVMAFRAVSAPMLRSEPGTLLETVAGTMTMGTQSSPCLPRAACNSSSDRKACRAEPSDCVFIFSARRAPRVVGESREFLVAQREERGRRNECQERKRPGVLSQRTAAKRAGLTPHVRAKYMAVTLRYRNMQKNKKQTKLLSWEKYRWPP